MDFKSLIQKIESIDGAIETPKAPTLPASVQLNEDAQLRVLSGQSTILAEAKKKADADEKEEAAESKKKAKKTDESSESSDAALNEYESKKGRYVHKGTRGNDYDAGSDDESEASDDESKAGKTAAERDVDREKDAAEEKKGKDWEASGKGKVTRVKDGKKVESVDPEIFKSKFARMVEAAKKGKKPDFLDVDKDGDKKEPMKKAVADKKKGAVKEASDSSTGGKTEKTKTGLKHTAGDKYKGSKYDAPQDGPRGGHRKDLDDLVHPMDRKKKKSESAMMPKGKKRPVKESVETKLSFREMMKLVVESGGQQQIDPLDKELFAWATRVARTKLGEGMRAEVYAGMTYERMGGTFQMYDVLSESHE